MIGRRSNIKGVECRVDQLRRHALARGAVPRNSAKIRISGSVIGVSRLAYRRGPYLPVYSSLLSVDQLKRQSSNDSGPSAWRSVDVNPRTRLRWLSASANQLSRHIKNIKRGLLCACPYPSRFSPIPGPHTQLHRRRCVMQHRRNQGSDSG